MSINTSHAGHSEGVVLFNGERLLIFYDGVEMTLKAVNPNEYMKNSKSGRIFLTSHRMIFITKSKKDALKSFSMPFINMKQVSIKQPIFGANSLIGEIYAEPTGGWNGFATFSFTFNKGGAIEFGMTLLDAGKRASQNRETFRPPNYFVPPCAQYYEAPPPAYSNVYQDANYGFVRQHDSFAPPPPGFVFVNMAYPPYPGTSQQFVPYYAAPPSTQQFNGHPPSYAVSTGPTYPSVNGNSNYVQPPSYNAGAMDMSEAERAKAGEAYATTLTQNTVQTGYCDPSNPNIVYTNPNNPPPYNPCFNDKKFD